MKMFDFLSVHPRLGVCSLSSISTVSFYCLALYHNGRKDGHGHSIFQLVQTLTFQAMSYIIIMLLVTLMSFGVARQSITFPNEKWNWLLVR